MIFFAKIAHQIHRIRELYCRSFKLLPTKMWNFVFFARRQIAGACLFVCLLFFSQGSSYRPSGPRMLQEKTDHGCVYIRFFFVFFFGFFSRGDRVDLRISLRIGLRISQEGLFKRKLKVLVPFVSDHKIGGHKGPLQLTFSPQNHYIKILR